MNKTSFDGFLFCVQYSAHPQQHDGAAWRGEVAWCGGKSRRALSPDWRTPASYDYVTQVSRANKSDLDHALSLSRSFCSMLIVAQLSGHAFFKDHHSLLTTFNYKYNTSSLCRFIY